MASLSLAAVASALDFSVGCTCTWLKEAARLELNRDKWQSIKVILLWARAQLSAYSWIPSKRARLFLRACGLRRFHPSTVSQDHPRLLFRVHSSA